MPILIADIARILPAHTRESLTEAGYRWTPLSTRAATAAQHSSASLLLVTYASPDPGTLLLLRQIRAESDVPLIVILGAVDARDAEQLFAAGADDCVVQPVRFGELRARMEAVRRRSSGQPKLAHEGVELRLLSRRALHEGRDLKLTPIEFAILRVLTRHAGHELPRRALTAEVWPDGQAPDSRALDVHLGRVRKKAPMLTITTLRGYGYRLEEP